MESEVKTENDNKKYLMLFGTGILLLGVIFFGERLLKNS